MPGAKLYLMKRLAKITSALIINLFITSPVYAAVCERCTPGPNGVATGLGCIPTDPNELARWVLCNGILMGGGIAFLLSAWGGLTILFSSGNPEKTNEGKQIITSAITGLLFIILSVFLLRLIGFDILKLPNFSL